MAALASSLGGCRSAAGRLLSVRADAAVAMEAEGARQLTARAVPRLRRREETGRGLGGSVVDVGPWWRQAAGVMQGVLDLAYADELDSALWYGLAVTVFAAPYVVGFPPALQARVDACHATLCRNGGPEAGGVVISSGERMVAAASQQALRVDAAEVVAAPWSLGDEEAAMCEWRLKNEDGHVLSSLLCWLDVREGASFTADGTLYSGAPDAMAGQIWREGGVRDRLY